MPEDRRASPLPNATPTHVIEELLTLAVVEPTLAVAPTPTGSRSRLRADNCGSDAVTYLEDGSCGRGSASTFGVCGRVGGLGPARSATRAICGHSAGGPVVVVARPAGLGPMLDALRRVSAGVWLAGGLDPTGADQ
jgi:hypothetical protein